MLGAQPTFRQHMTRTAGVIVEDDIGIKLQVGRSAVESHRPRQATVAREDELRRHALDQTRIEAGEVQVRVANAERVS